MSYSKKYHERIPVRYSGSKTVSYPASQNGGSHTVYFDGITYEDINTYIDVDTQAFDRSVANCNVSVNTLTGAVVATEAAQIASIDANAKKVGGTIIERLMHKRLISSRQ